MTNTTKPSPEGFAVFDNYRKTIQHNIQHFQVSEVLMDAAKVLEQFIAALFSIETEMKQLQSKYADEEAIMRLKSTFIKRVKFVKDIPCWPKSGTIWRIDYKLFIA